VARDVLLQVDGGAIVGRNALSGLSSAVRGTGCDDAAVVMRAVAMSKARRA
jgi:hypothetical protein